MADSSIASDELVFKPTIGDRTRTHGCSKTRTYKIWCGIWKRCTDKNTVNFHRYGGRGISVCERWKSFQSFLDDMGNCPNDVSSIDRYPDNDGNYEPGNCRWATPKQQARNTRSNRLLAFRGEVLSMAEWAERLSLDPRVLFLRLKRGWSIEQTLTGVKPKRRNPSAKINEQIVAQIRSHDGLSTRQLAKHYSISQTQVRNILSGKHWK